MKKPAFFLLGFIVSRSLLLFPLSCTSYSSSCAALASHSCCMNGCAYACRLKLALKGVGPATSNYIQKSSQVGMCNMSTLMSRHAGFLPTNRKEIFAPFTRKLLMPKLAMTAHNSLVFTLLSACWLNSDVCDVH